MPFMLLPLLLTVLWGWVGPRKREGKSNSNLTVCSVLKDLAPVKGGGKTAVECGCV